MTSPATRPGAGSARPYRFPVTEQVTLQGGLTVVTAPLRRLPAATVVLLTPAGGEHEQARDAGLASLTALGLTEGTTQRDTSALATAFEQLGGEMFSGVEWTHAECGTTVMASRLDATMGLIAEAVRHPAFPVRGVERLRDERLAELLQQQSEPRGLADDSLLASCFPADHRLAQPLGGSMASVQRCNPDLVRAFHNAHTGPTGSVLIVTGDVDPDAVVREAERHFGTWEGRRADAPVERATSPRPARRVRLLHRPEAPQSEIRVGHASVTRIHPDFHAIAVMNAILGGLFNSRINLNLRERNAYTYGAFSVFDWRRSASVFEVSTAVQSDVTARAIGEILAEIDRMQQDEVTPAELSLAIDYLTGVFPLRFETTAAIANALALRIGYGLELSYHDTYRDRVRAVDAAAVRRAAREHLDLALLQVVVVGDARVVEPGLVEASLGPVERLDSGA